jgi:hypothetical protein
MGVRTLEVRQPYDAAFSIDALAPEQVDGFFSVTDDEAPGMRARSPGDSHYEMSAVFDDGYDDSDDEMAAFDPGSSDDNEALVPSGVEPGSAEIFLPGPWYFKFIDAWGRFQFFTALGFAAASLSVLGFLLVRAVVGGHILSSSITALILGCVGTIAFLMLSLSATVLIVLLVDLARNVRQLIQHAERNPDKPGARSARNQPKFSHPVV